MKERGRDAPRRYFGNIALGRDYAGLPFSPLASLCRFANNISVFLLLPPLLPPLPHFSVSLCIQTSLSQSFKFRNRVCTYGTWTRAYVLAEASEGSVRAGPSTKINVSDVYRTIASVKQWPLCVCVLRISCLPPHVTPVCVYVRILLFHSPPFTLLRPPLAASYSANVHMRAVFFRQKCGETCGNEKKNVEDTYSFIFSYYSTERNI